MKESRMRNWRRRVSGFLAFVMTASLVLSDASIALAADAADRFFQEHGKLTEDGAYSKATLSSASFENNREDELSISIFSGPDSDFRAGGTVYLDVHIKNETGGMITDGVLSYKAKGVEDRHTYFEEPDEDPVVSGSFVPEIDENGVSDSADIELINDLESGYAEDDYPDDGAFYYDDEDAYRTREYVAGTSDEKDDPRDENGRLKSIEGITLAPGEIYTAHFVYEIDEDISTAKNQNVLFKFKGEGEGDHKRIRKEEMFRYTVNFLNIDGVMFEDDNEVETGEEVTMGIHTSLYDFDAVLEDSSIDMEELATPSNATPSDASPSNAFATPSDAEEDEELMEEEEDEDTFVVDLGDSTYKIQMVNAKLNDFQVRKALVSDAYENMLICTFRVSKSVKPGVYFGSVLQETKAGGKTYRSNQGFSLIVTGDGEITLEGKAGDSEVVVTGPVTSFPDADQLAVRVAEVDADQQAMVDAALEKKAAEEGTEVNSYKALDIKIYADGEEVEPTGPIQVAFKNIQLEEKQNLAQKAVAAVANVLSDEPKEEETSQIKVFHLDEEQTVANEMPSTVDEDGTVVMDTDHFSIYIVVNVGDVKEVQVEVHHWATLDEWKVNNDGTVSEIEYNNKLYPGANKNDQYNQKEYEIYEVDYETLPNGSGTGLGYSIAVSNWSKVALGGNYKVEKVKVTNSKYPSGQVFTEDSTLREIEMAKGPNRIDIYYKPTEEEIKGYVGFHDYNVSIAASEANQDKYVTDKGWVGIVHPGITTYRVGINNWSLKTTTDRIGVGIAGSSNAGENYDSYVWYDYMKDYNRGSSTLKKGLVKDNLDKNGDLQFSYGDPGLFDTKDIQTKETYWNGSKNETVNNYMAKKYLSDYMLGFKRKGDTYTLQSVYDKSGKPLKIYSHNNKLITPDFSVLQKTGTAYNNPNKGVYSNLFWPMDTVSYGSVKTKDPLFGNNYGFPANDESTNVKHNWFFGMRYDFKFTIGEYTGPMNYYFRGDDDFWLYIDGKLVKDVEIGGIHSAIGRYVDLEKWLKDNGLLEYDKDGNLTEKSKNTEHQMSVFFMERGGTGSCCYMRFTLPNVSSVPTPEAVTIEKTVTKKWIDGNNEAGLRPSYIYVQLKQGNEKYGAPVRLDASNGWKHTWTDLPKYSAVESNAEHEYTVEEVGTPPGYEATVNGMTITNTLKADVSIKKEWKGDVKEASVQVQLFKKNGTTYTPAGEKATLNAGNQWTTSWTALPVYDDNGQKITYTPWEVDASGNRIEAGTAIMDGKYIVTYDRTNSSNTIVTNTYNWTTVSVEKTWEDHNNAYNTRPTAIKVQLYQDGTPYGNPVDLNSTKGWKYTWENLPVKPSQEGAVHKYTVKELTTSEQPLENNQTGIIGTTSTGKQYNYTVSYDQNSKPIKITNKLVTAKLRLKKVINNQNDLANEPIDQEYKFLIHLKDETGKIYTTVALAHEENSGDILIIPPATGTEFTVEEVIPMEYEMTGMVSAPEGKLSGTVNGSTVTVKPGDDILITVTNVPDHSGYFHNTESVTNVKGFDGGTGGDFQQGAVYTEPDGKDDTSSQTTVALVREMIVATVEQNRNSYKERLLERGDDILG